MVHVLGLSFAACDRSYTTLLYHAGTGRFHSVCFTIIILSLKQRHKKKPVCTGLLRHISIIQLATYDFTIGF